MENLQAEKRKREKELETLRNSEPKLIKEIASIKEEMMRMRSELEVIIYDKLLSVCLLMSPLHCTAPGLRGHRRSEEAVRAEQGGSDGAARVVY